MRPVAFAAEHPEHHDSGFAQRTLDIEIDRSRMPERQQVGQPYAGKIFRQGRMRGTERRKIADCRWCQASDACAWKPLLTLQRTAYGVAIKSLQPDHYEMLGLLHIRPCKCEFDPASDPLHHDRGRLVGDAGVALDAQHV